MLQANQMRPTVSSTWSVATVMLTGLTKACSDRSMPAVMSVRYPASVLDVTVLKTAMKLTVWGACRAHSLAQTAQLEIATQLTVGRCRRAGDSQVHEPLPDGNRGAYE